MKFSIRDLFWLVLVVACLCGWLAHYRYMSQDRRKIVEAIHDAGYGLSDDLSFYYLFPLK